MMIRLAFQTALLLVLAFTVCVGVIRAGPRDDSPLREFIAPPEGCEAPCWQGVRLGTMNAEQAGAILRRHPWVDEVFRADRIDALTWRWNGMQPAFVPMERGFMSLRAGDIVVGATVETTIPLGDVFLILGVPETIYVVGDSDLIFVFPHADMDVQVRPRCPMNLRRLWTLSTELRWKFEPSEHTNFSRTTLHPPAEPGWLDALFECRG